MATTDEYGNRRSSRPRGSASGTVDLSEYQTTEEADARYDARFERLSVFNVKSFGGIGNGTAKDRDAILLAIAAAVANGGGKVYCPAGAYLNVAIDDTTDFINIPSNVQLVGDGREASTIHQPEFALLGESFIRMIQADHARIAHIGLTSDVVEESKGISVTDGFHCVIEDCYLVEGFGTGITFTSIGVGGRGNLHNTCTRNLVEATTREHSILLTSGSYNVISYNHTFDSEACGIEVWRDDVGGIPQENNQLVGNVLSLPKSHGITIHGDRGLLVSGNQILDAGSHGINATRADYGSQTPCESLLIEANTITNAGRLVGGGMAISLSVAPGARVIGNTIQAARYRAIHTMAANTSISGNTIKNAAGGGVYVDNSNGTATGCSVVDNHFTDCGGGVGSSVIELSDTTDAKVALNTFVDTRAGAARCEFGVKIPVSCDNTMVVSNKATNLAGRIVDDASTTSHVVGHVGAANKDRTTTSRPSRRVAGNTTLAAATDCIVEVDTAGGARVLTPDFDWLPGQELEVVPINGTNSVQLADFVNGGFGMTWTGAWDNRRFRRLSDNSGWTRITG